MRLHERLLHEHADALVAHEGSSSAWSVRFLSGPNEGMVILLKQVGEDYLEGYDTGGTLYFVPFSAIRTIRNVTGDEAYDVQVVK